MLEEVNIEFESMKDTFSKYDGYSINRDNARLVCTHHNLENVLGLEEILWRGYILMVEGLDLQNRVLPLGDGDEEKSR